FGYLNANITGFNARMTVIPLDTFFDDKFSNGPSIVLGVTLTCSIVVTLLISSTLLGMKKFMNEKNNRLLVQEREK
ncbi:MAG: hypothetical protein ACK56I_32140, partial [bacterium]